MEGFNLKTILLLVGLIVPTVLMFLGSNNSNFEKTVAVRTKISMAVIMLVFSIVMLFLGGNVLMNGLIFIVLAVLVSMALSYVKKSKLIDIALIVLMIAIIANQYLPLFGIVL